MKDKHRKKMADDMNTDDLMSDLQNLDNGTETKEELNQEALNLQQAIQGKDRQAKMERDSRSVYVSNLHFRATEEDVRKVFEEVGTVVSVTILKDHQTGRLKGACYVEFESAEDVSKAVCLSDTPILERNITVAKKLTPVPRSKRRDVPNTPYGRGMNPMMMFAQIMGMGGMGYRGGYRGRGRGRGRGMPPASPSQAPPPAAAPAPDAPAADK